MSTELRRRTTSGPNDLTFKELPLDVDQTSFLNSALKHIELFLTGLVIEVIVSGSSKNSGNNIVVKNF